ncbi:MAG: hypothetical protein IJY04_03460 [Clostridia bacterium]|nr:hypothetical protein [Clostridia bacterium]
MDVNMNGSLKEILLCKYGEIVLKGLNKSQFESVMLKEIRRRVEKCGGGKVTKSQSTVYIDPEEFTDIDMLIEELQKVFGIVSICRAAVVEKDMDAILTAAKEYLPDKLAGYKTFRADAKRADKRSLEVTRNCCAGWWSGAFHRQGNKGLS